MTSKEAFTIMDAIAYTLCMENGADFMTSAPEDELDWARFTEWVNERTREIFEKFCEENGIDEIEEG